MAKTIFSGVKNSEIFKLAQAASPQFKAQTAHLTAEKLDEGWEANKTLDPEIVSEWYKVTMRVILEKVQIATVKNPIENYGIVENFADEWGNTAQRIAVMGMKPVNPAFIDIDDGDSVDQQVVRKPTLNERFFIQNFQFQNWFTLDSFRIKQILQSAYGMDQITSGVMQQMENSFTKARYLNELEALSHGINSTKHPLQKTQKINVGSWTDGNITDEQLRGFIEDVKNLVSNMLLSPSTSAYNAGKFETAIDTNSLVLLVRPEILNYMQTRLLAGAFNKEDLTLPIEVKPILNFGGMVPYHMNEDAVEYLYPVYDQNGVMIGWNADATGVSQDVTVQVGEELYEDTNENALGVVIQKGAIFTTMQNGVSMKPAPYNSRGEYQNFFFNVKNAGVHFDYFYNMVVIAKPEA